MPQKGKDINPTIDTLPYVCVIGAANIDIVGFSKNPLRYKDDNLGKLNISMGGVGRNIAENLVRLGLLSKLICPIGDDLLSQQIIAHCNKIGIDIKDSLFLKNQASSVHMSIMDQNNDLAIGLSAMGICDKIKESFIEQKKEVIANAAMVVMETNIPEPILAKIINDNPAKKYFLDTVSGSQCMRAKGILNHLYVIKANQLEAELLSGLKISTDNDHYHVANYFHQKGVKHVFITLGANGVFYSNDELQITILPKQNKIVNTNGAGDAFSAGVIYGFVNNCAENTWAKIGMACAELTVMHADTVSPKMNHRIFDEIN